MEGVVSIFVNGDLEVASLVLGVFVRLVDVGGIVINFSDGHGSKLTAVLVIGHEEDSIVFIGVEPDSLLFTLIDRFPVGIVI